MGTSIKRGVHVGPDGRVTRAELSPNRYARTLPDLTPLAGGRFYAVAGKREVGYILGLSPARQAAHLKTLESWEAK